MAVEQRYGGGVRFADGIAQLDAFARLRISQPETIFDSKQCWDNAPLFWDESGTASSHSTSDARSRLSVGSAASTIRQTFQRFNYQPGKSQLLFFTFGAMAVTGDGVVTIGLGDGTDSLDLLYTTSGAFVRRISTSSVGSSAVAQASWNIDTMDGNGPSKKTIDWTKAQIMFIDFEWLGVGTVAFGFVIDRVPYYVHYFHHSNIEAGVYLPTPNLPLRITASSSVAGSAVVDHICSTVISEGGSQETGLTRGQLVSAHCDANSIGTWYMASGIRVKTAYNGVYVRPESIALRLATNDPVRWAIFLNPTIAGSPTWNNQTNSAVEFAQGATANTLSNLIPVAVGMAEASAMEAVVLNKVPRPLGFTIGGTQETYVLGVNPFSSNADVWSGINWRERL